MKTYFDNYDKKYCNGCGTCALRCPKKAIIMKKDKEGFVYPEIDKDKCINCGLCEKICSINIDEKIKNNIENTDTYLAYTKNKDDKKRSSSGGMFFPLARYIIEDKKGVVFGVEMTKEIKAQHSYAETIGEAKKFQGSKYVKSDLNNSFEKVEDFLKADRYVLFTGTPCQCQGLRKYLRKEYDKLITCEIVCHANPSPMILDMYLKNIENIYHKKVKMIYFRSKETGWKKAIPIIELEDGKKIEEKSYKIAFTQELINRPSCTNCYFCTENRYSDFTIGDFWGATSYDKSIIDDDTGLSLFCVNTDKGKDILKQIKNNLYLKKMDIIKSFSYNHHKNVLPHKNRNRFFAEISTGKINESNIIEYMKKYGRVPLSKRIIRKIKKLVKKILKRVH